MARILLAEDDATMVGLLSTLLRMDGHEVTAVDGDGDVAAAVNSFSPDALLLDALFGLQSGLELVPQIRHEAPDRRLYILMMSGLSLREDCLRCGADDFLMKPFDPVELMGLLRANLPGS